MAKRNLRATDLSVGALGWYAYRTGGDDDEVGTGDSGPELLRRPWLWTLTVAQTAADAQRYNITGICLWWAHNWKQDMQPHFKPYERTLWPVSAVPSDVRDQLRTIAATSLAKLPSQTVLFGNVTGQVTAGWLAKNVERLC